MKYSIVTFGCRVNQADSLRLEEQLLARGAVPSSSSDADVVFVNTCSVTASADQGARQTIRRIARENPSAQIVATGCYATRRPADIEALPHVIRVVPNQFQIRSSRRRRAGNGAAVRRRRRAVRGCDSPRAWRAGRRSRCAVQTGCQERCSYCIIPTTRGSGRSMPLAPWSMKSTGSPRRVSRKSF